MRRPRLVGSTKYVDVSSLQCVLFAEFFLFSFPDIFPLLPMFLVSPCSYHAFLLQSVAGLDLVNRLFLWFAVVLVPVASFSWDAFPRGS